MDLSESAVVNSHNLPDTSLEMVKITLISEDRTTDHINTADKSLSDGTLGPELPSLPANYNSQEEPISLSQIELVERNCMTY